MFTTAIVHRDSIELAACDCHMVYRNNRVWPLNDFTPKGPGRGILAPQSGPLQVFGQSTVGVFELNNMYELVWKNTPNNTSLQAYIGSNGKYLKTAITLREIERLQVKFNFSYKVLVKKDQSIKVTIERN